MKPFFPRVYDMTENTTHIQATRLQVKTSRQAHPMQATLLQSQITLCGRIGNENKKDKFLFYNTASVVTCRLCLAIANYCKAHA